LDGFNEIAECAINKKYEKLVNKVKEINSEFK
jgi:hypothetical protein